MKDEQILGCGTTGLWTKIVGWFEIIGTLTIITTLTIALFVGPTGSRKNDEVAFEQLQRNNVIMSLMLLLAILSFIMGIFLLQGSYKDSSRQIKAWIAFTIISLVLLALVTVVGILIQSDVILIVSMACSLTVQGFCLWIVNVHKNHIESCSAISAPIKV